MASEVCLQVSAAVTWDVMHNAIWRHCSKRPSDVQICVLGSFYHKGCGVLEAPILQICMLSHGKLN